MIVDALREHSFVRRCLRRDSRRHDDPGWQRHLAGRSPTAGNEGPLTVHLGSGNATINGSGGGTSIFVGTGDIQIIADGALSITGNDGVETAMDTEHR